MIAKVTDDNPDVHEETAGIAGPLRYPAFRNIWLTGLVSNLGTLIQAVGAAWAMTELTSDAQMVALVQTASSAPMMLFAFVGGALADLYNRRRVAMIALAIGFVAALALAAISGLGMATPLLILILCFLLGCGNTLFAPAWQSSVREQVPVRHVPAAVALNSISYNLGRSFGPAVGGVIVATAGAFAAFIANALSFIPIFVALWRWKPPERGGNDGRESLGRAIGLGITYVLNAPTIRTVLLRTVFAAFGNSAVLALTPLVAAQLLGRGALTYGLLLGGFGIGAVLGALSIPVVRRRHSSEAMVRASGVMIGMSLIIIAVSRSPLLTGLALLFAGVFWTMGAATYNVVIQLSAARWVVGRAVSSYQTATAGGIALGSLAWGTVANHFGLVIALIAAGIFGICAQLLGLRAPVPTIGEVEDELAADLPDPDARLPLQARSGPVVVIVEFRIVAENAQRFADLMVQMRRARRRSGATDWTVARDILEPEIWIEQFWLPTWSAYLQFRSRQTIADRRIYAQLVALHRGEGRPGVRRLVGQSALHAERDAAPRFEPTDFP